MLRLIRDALGDLDRVDYIVRAIAMVSGKKGFSEIYKVADGFSDIMTGSPGRTRGTCKKCRWCIDPERQCPYYM